MKDLVASSAPTILTSTCRISPKGEPVGGIIAGRTLAKARHKVHLFDASRVARMLARPLDHDDFGLNQPEIIVIDFNNLERDIQVSLCNLHELDCAGKPVSAFPHPALASGQRFIV
ncbi:MAG: hypothetical protein ACLPID_11235 [Beijerinckiaceae bacterium]